MVASLSSSNTCGACKLMRRKCSPDCTFAPYFSGNKSHMFKKVHLVFGAHKAASILQAHPDKGEEVANSMALDAECRLNDPINGCQGVIKDLQQRMDRQTDENKRLIEEYESLKRKLLSENKRLIEENQKLSCENQWLTKENSCLKRKLSMVKRKRALSFANLVRALLIFIPKCSHTMADWSPGPFHMLEDILELSD
eukprot:TRINITY_DN2587_c0_g2_i1.p1 TRINITY_DN2587_c0_g2~~TRINITY_DN2587_c0_g2_i1.p1  ORF type:complete len:197 (+),score=10.27 TRINITY_DN2587_c0_g2_i1:441-1031(+)